MDNRYFTYYTFNYNIKNQINERSISCVGWRRKWCRCCFSRKKDWAVFLSDKNIIKSKFKKILIENDIDFEEGIHSHEIILKAKEVIKSPGIPNDVDIIKKISRKNIPIISEIEFAYRFTNANIIAVTGSNEEDTTTLIYEILKSANLNVGIAGNIGNSFALLIAQKI